jgi:hypothetical protein
MNMRPAPSPEGLDALKDIPMRNLPALCTFAVAAVIATPATALKNDDYAGMMGMLWRLREPLCPSMSFDPEKFVKAMKLPGGSAAAFQRAHRTAFDQRYAVVADWMSQQSNPEFCKAMEVYFDGKHDFQGNIKEVPEATIPGLTIR